MILVIDNYDSFTFNLVQMIGALGADVQTMRNDAVDATEVLALRPTAVVISPGPSHPDHAGNSPAILSALVQAMKTGQSTHVLGVCLGHQMIGRAFGARVGPIGKPMHGKTSEVHHDGAGVFTGIEAPMIAGRYHSLAIVEETLPQELHVSARTSDGVVMGVRHRTLPIEGVQFHPESVLTGSGEHVLRNFVGQLGTFR